MEAACIRDLRLPIAVAALVAMAALSVGMSTSYLLKAEKRGPAMSVPDAGKAPAKSRRPAKAAQDSKGKTKNGGSVPPPAQEFKGKTKNGG